MPRSTHTLLDPVQPRFIPTPQLRLAQIGTESSAIYLFTCYSEGEGLLHTTLDSISTTNYPDPRKPLFVVANHNHLWLVVMALGGLFW